MSLQASGALASCKLQPPSSQLMKPKSISNPSTRNGLSKPLGAGLKQPTSRLTTTTMINRGSKIAKPSNADTATTLRQPTVQRGAGQPRLMMAAPSAALRKKKVVVGGATENPTMARRQPFTASTPISSRCVCVYVCVWYVTLLRVLTYCIIHTCKTFFIAEGRGKLLPSPPPTSHWQVWKYM